MCSRLGGKSIILGNVGNDDNGKAYIENFKVTFVRKNSFTDPQKLTPQDPLKFPRKKLAERNLQLDTAQLLIRLNEL